jgi:hypothetical protein
MAIATIVTVTCDTCAFETTDNTGLHYSQRIEKAGTTLGGHSAIQRAKQVDMCGDCAREFEKYAEDFLSRKGK